MRSSKLTSHRRHNDEGIRRGCEVNPENKIDCGSRTCMPYSVCRCRQDDHSSGPHIAVRLKRPTRRLWRAEPARVFRQARRLDGKSLPIWSCSVWGLPCPAHYCVGGALLPHLFTLTWALRPGRYVFCGTFRPTGLNRPSRTLSGTLLCGVRTFLCLATATVRPGCQPIHYSAGNLADKYAAKQGADKMQATCFLLRGFLGREEKRIRQ